jgi:hypothetical protein
MLESHDQAIIQQINKLDTSTVTQTSSAVATLQLIPCRESPEAAAKKEGGRWCKEE